MPKTRAAGRGGAAGCVLLGVVWLNASARLQPQTLHCVGTPNALHVRLRRPPHPLPQAAVLAGVAPCLPGMAASLGLAPAPPPPAFAAVYDAAWFVGAAVSSLVYAALMRGGAATEPAGGAAPA